MSEPQGAESASGYLLVPEAGPGRRRRRLVTGTITADKQLTSVGCRLLGYSVRETTGAAAAAAAIQAGNSTNAESAFEVGCASGTSHELWLGWKGWPMPEGVFVHVISGSVSVTCLVELPLEIDT